MQQYRSSFTQNRSNLLRPLFTGDVGRKVWITVGLVVIYRILLNIPLPGFTSLENAPTGPDGAAFTLIKFVDMVSGGGLLRTSILGLGLLPFTTAGQIIQLLIPIVPALYRRMQDDPREGRRWVERWQYYLAVPIAAWEAWTFINLSIMNCGELKFVDLTSHLTLLSKITVVAILVVGSFFAVWIASLISEYGIRGQGLSILVLSGILGSLPGQLKELLEKPELTKDIVVYIVIFVGSILAVIYIQSGRRNVPVVYPGRRLATSRPSMATATLPLMVNMAGVEGFIGSQLIIALATVYAPRVACTEIQWLRNLAMGVISIFSESGPLFGPVAFTSVFLFTSFYSDVLFQQQNYGEALKRAGAMIPGLHSGSATQNYLTRINRRINVVGAMLMAILAITPWLSNLMAGTNLPLLDGERIVIMVGVIRDAVMNLEAELKLHGYQDSLLMR